MFDKDGYPTEEILEKLTKWEFKCRKDFEDIFALFKDLWVYDAWEEYVNEDGEYTYEISTYGWSGNEEVIAALKSNFIFWSFCWYSSQRGGHYKFVFPNIKWN
jgi:hypothetical protein